MKVVLPAPFGPISAWRAPASSRKLMSRAAASAPKFLLSERVSSSVSVMTAARLARGSGCRSVSHSPMMPLRANSAISTSSRPRPSCQAVG